jgi:hypothetical protein
MVSQTDHEGRIINNAYGFSDLCQEAWLVSRNQWMLSAHYNNNNNIDNTGQGTIYFRLFSSKNWATVPNLLRRTEISI